MAHVFVVDDDPINRDILEDNLAHAGYTTLSAENGAQAWRTLNASPQLFSAILLDRILPDTDGLDILRRIKHTPGLAHIPVIMQTAKSDPADIVEGLKSGAYYYLTKPFLPDTLLAIVDTAVNDYRDYCQMRDKVQLASRAFIHMTSAEFAFREPDQARDIAALLANACPDPQRAILGLAELMLNAIEHGNLGIAYAEKTELIRADSLQHEITHRLKQPEYADRQAVVSVRRSDDELNFIIRDQGTGFNWQNYLEMSPERAFDNHGRGIAMARLLSFDNVDYNETGNEVCATLRTRPATP